jgi:hypothetical protein
MAKPAPKKPNFPAKACPQCDTLIPARSKSHLACGWVMVANNKVPAVIAQRSGYAKKPAATPRGHLAGAGTISVDDIAAVKALVDRMGAEKVQQLARVLAH